MTFLVPRTYSSLNFARQSCMDMTGNEATMKLLKKRAEKAKKNPSDSEACRRCLFFC